MADELRLLYDAAYLQRVGCALADATGKPSVANAYASRVLHPPWTEMALKARMGRMAEVLAEFLPDDYAQAVEILKIILPEVSGGKNKFDDFLSMFVPEYVVNHGLDHWQISMNAMEFFTHQGTSSEFAIRPFLLADLNRAMVDLEKMAHHPHPDVRRFASEGSRPRLPWAVAIPALKSDPAPILPILETLRADPSEFVRRSVANNLNDIAKDHPEVTLNFTRRFLGHSADTDRLLKHGCRTLLKRGNPDALAMFGAGPVVIEAPELRLSAQSYAMGERLEFSFRGRLAGDLPKTLRLEYAIDFMKARGVTSRKVFKISEGKPARNIETEKSYSFVDLSTRKHHRGAHGLAIIVNGVEVASATFTLN